MSKIVVILAALTFLGISWGNAHFDDSSEKPVSLISFLKKSISGPVSFYKRHFFFTFFNLLFSDSIRRWTDRRGSKTPGIHGICCQHPPVYPPGPSTTSPHFHGSVHEIQGHAWKPSQIEFGSKLEGTGVNHENLRQNLARGSEKGKSRGCLVVLKLELCLSPNF